MNKPNQGKDELIPREVLAAESPNLEKRMAILPDLVDHLVEDAVFRGCTEGQSW